MRLTVGNKVVYPGRGPCLIGAVVNKVVCGTSASFYRLALLDDSSAELFVPVEKSSDLQLRALLDRSEIPKLLANLKTRAGAARDSGPKSWRQRNVENLELFNSGSIFDLARMVESLTQLSATKTLAPNERETLQRARKLVVSEIAAVMDESKTAAEARIDRVLEAGKKKANRRQN
ncbi:MAG TPA: CarD family transcriptional regulator [Candidatus Binatia bacterium]|jgi:RNA polymerase-interacting CarD/CdnL/TRCF family regulator